MDNTYWQNFQQNAAYTRAFNSELTPTASEFVPRSYNLENRGNSQFNNFNGMGDIHLSNQTFRYDTPVYDDLRNRNEYFENDRENRYNTQEYNRIERSNYSNFNGNVLVDKNKAGNGNKRHVHEVRDYNRNKYYMNSHRENRECHAKNYSKNAKNNYHNGINRYENCNAFRSDVNTFNDSKFQSSSHSNNNYKNHRNSNMKYSENTVPKHFSHSGTECVELENNIFNTNGLFDRQEESFVNNGYNEGNYNTNKFYHNNYSENVSADTGVPCRVFENSKYKINNKQNKNTVTSSASNFRNKKSTNLNITVQQLDVSICQRDHLIEQLKCAKLECLVCCEKVKQREPVWSCGNCYHVLHFWCIVRWAKSSKDENGIWRCPACQNENTAIPDYYMCFCGRTRLHTEWNRIDTPHSCGEICNRNKIKTDLLACVHDCTLLCHPGPCPTCTIQVTRKCGCGKTSQVVQCGVNVSIICDNICDKKLNCGIHHCTEICHIDECKPCDTKIKIECCCGKTNKEEICGSNNDVYDQFTCGLICGRKLDCGNHLCPNSCHEGSCQPCSLLPSVVTTCPCGKMILENSVRSSCLEPLLTCDNICGKLLPCGSPHKPHFCGLKCHEGDCGPCKKETVIKCRCGNNDKTVPCVDLGKRISDFRCKKKCTKKRSCGKHKCNQMCCIDLDHICPLKCSGMLSCGKHRCDLLCHRGKCGSCLQSSFDDLYCDCGKTVIYAPISCGTKPPVCEYPCIRQRECGHATLHNCHSEGTCPPCIVFTDRLCYGGHELRKTIPCYQKEFSCGLPCGNSLPCGLHTCNKPCHSGECLKPDEKCTQSCTKIRSLCGHLCLTPCHPDTETCPDASCRQMVKVSCPCGNRVTNHPCAEHVSDYQHIISSTLATKMAEVQLGHSVNTGDVTEKINQKKLSLKILECNEECSIIMRNRRLALCLQIQNPDLSAKIAPRFSDFMKQWAKKDPAFCQHVHDKLTSLVQLAKESKQKSRSYSFDIMNREKRQFVHEYCAHFGCESQAYDAEPKRNIVTTAVKDKCWLPAHSLLELKQREMGYRKVHVPSLNNKKNMSIRNGCYEPASNMIIMPVLPSTSSC